jgi:hypothetical protein
METEKANLASSQMWEKLATQLAEAVPDFVTGGDPLKAIQYGICAEACFWQSTGEADAFGIKECLEKLSIPSTDRTEI